MRLIQPCKNYAKSILLLFTLPATFFAVLACSSEYSSTFSFPSQTHTIPEELRPEPKDILSQLYVFGGGGPGLAYCGYKKGRDFGSEPFVAIEDFFGRGSDSWRVDGIVFFAHYYSICIANFFKGDTVQLVIVGPDSVKKELDTVYIDESFWDLEGASYWAADLFVTLEMPKGAYKLIAQSERESAEYQFNVTHAPLPSCLLVETGDQIQINYSGFNPYQKIKVWAGNLGSKNQNFYSAQWVTEMNEAGEAIDILDRSRPNEIAHQEIADVGFTVILGEYSEDEQKEFIVRDDLRNCEIQFVGSSSWFRKQSNK